MLMGDFFKEEFDFSVSSFFFSVAEYRVSNIQFLSKNSGEGVLVCTFGECDMHSL